MSSLSRSAVVLSLLVACCAAAMPARAAGRTTLRIELQVIGGCELRAAAASANCGPNQPLAVSPANGSDAAETALLTPQSPQLAAQRAPGAKRDAAGFTTFTF